MIEKSEQESGDVDYRPISVVAIISLVLSLSALLTIVVWWLVFFPLAAVVLAVWEYWRISRSDKLGYSDKPMAGRNLALAAIFIATSISSAAISFKIALDTRMYGTARKYTDQWFDYLLQGDAHSIYRAHQLTKEPGARVNQDKDEHLDAYYDPDFVLLPGDAETPPTKPIDDLKKLLSLDPAFSIMKLKEEDRLDYVKFIRRAPERFSELNREVFTLVYEISPSIHVEGKPMVLKMMIERRRYPQPVGVQWRVTDRKYVSGGPPQDVEIIAQ